MLVMIAFWCLWAAPLECDWHVEMPMCFRTVGAALVNVPYMCSSFVCIYVSLRVCVSPDNLVGITKVSSE